MLLITTPSLRLPVLHFYRIENRPSILVLVTQLTDLKVRMHSYMCILNRSALVTGNTANENGQPSVKDAKDPLTRVCEGLSISVPLTLSQGLSDVEFHFFLLQLQTPKFILISRSWFHQFREAPQLLTLVQK